MLARLKRSPAAASASSPESSGSASVKNGPESDTTVAADDERRVEDGGPTSCVPSEGGETTSPDGSTDAGHGSLGPIDSESGEGPAAEADGHTDRDGATGARPQTNGGQTDGEHVKSNGSPHSDGALGSDAVPAGSAVPEGAGGQQQKRVADLDEASSDTSRPARRGSNWSVRSSVVDLRDKYGPQVSTRLERIRDKVQRFFTSFGDKMGNVVEGTTRSRLSPFQKEKLLHEFFVFFDRDKNGRLTFADFCLLRDHICQLSGWQPGSAKRKQTEDLFLHMWHDLQLQADVDHDDAITVHEWLLMWENIYKGLRTYFKQKKQHPSIRSAPPEDAVSSSSSETAQKMAEPGDTTGPPVPQAKGTDEKNPWPEWVHAYLEYRFNLYDRTGDGVIDEEEFVYVLTDFGVRERFSRQAWKMFTLGSGENLTFDYFCQLAEQYYLSNDPADVGNFLTGKLDFVAGEYADM